MTVKVTMLFKLATTVSDPVNPAKRIGGWSESWYDSSSFDQSKADFLGGADSLCAKRAAMLPIGASIIGQRMQLVNPTGPVQTYRNLFPGSSGIQADVPQMALLYSMPALGANNVRRVILRGIPDARVVEGEYSPSAAFKAALDAFNSQLTLFNFRGKDSSAPKFVITTISNLGVVRTLTPTGYVPGDLVQVNRSITSPSNLPVSGRFAVDSIGPDTSTITLRSWVAGPANGGNITRAANFFYPNCDSRNAGTPEVIVRKVGRPFDPYRGRHSKRKA